MPMGIVSDDEFESEIDKLTNKTDELSKHEQGSSNISATIIDKLGPGRREGDVEVPNSLRKIIGEESLINGRASALQIASDFGISPSSTSAYNKGATSTSTYNNPHPNKKHLNQVKEKIVKKARNKLISALNNITDEKLETAKVKDLSGIAKDMSAVIKNMEPETSQSGSGNNSPTFVFYAPQIRKESDFDIIQVKE